MSLFVMAGIALAASIVVFVLRARIARFFAWFHREAPGGGGERMARKSTPHTVLTTSILWFVFGVYLLLKAFGIVEDGP